MHKNYSTESQHELISRRAQGPVIIECFAVKLVSRGQFGDQTMAQHIIVMMITAHLLSL